MMYARQIIMLHILNSAVWQLYINKDGRKNNGKLKFLNQ